MGMDITATRPEPWAILSRGRQPTGTMPPGG